MGNAGQRYAAEQIVNKLREAEVEPPKGQTIALMSKKLAFPNLEGDTPLKDLVPAGP